MGKEKSPKLNVDGVEKLLVERIIEGKSNGHAKGWRRKDLIANLAPDKADETTVNRAMERIGATCAGIVVRHKADERNGITHDLDPAWTTDELIDYVEHPPLIRKD